MAASSSSIRRAGWRPRSSRCAPPGVWISARQRRVATRWTATTACGCRRAKSRCSPALAHAGRGEPRYGFANEASGRLPSAHTRRSAATTGTCACQNRRFADAVCAEVDTDDRSSRQDYHFAGAGLIRARLPRATVIMFWHIRAQPRAAGDLPVAQRVDRRHARGDRFQHAVAATSTRWTGILKRVDRERNAVARRTRDLRPCKHLARRPPRCSNVAACRRVPRGRHPRARSGP
jgi:hypothetical protein